MESSLEAKRSVLLIEDNENLRTVWKLLFKRAGYQIRIYEDGQSALDALSWDGLPDIVVTDYFLPDRNGIDVINEVKRQRPSLPCILVTGNDDDDLIASIDPSAGVQYLRKPVKFAALVDVIEAMLQNAAGLAAMPNHPPVIDNA